MTIVVWDGKTLAADKKTMFGYSSYAITKIFKIDGALIGISGDAVACMEIVQWFRSGRNISSYPRFEKETDIKVDIICIEPNRMIKHFAKSPYATIVEDSQFCIGSGSEFAKAALYLGENAAGAVQVACALDSYCGMGFDTLQLDSQEGK